MKKITVYGSGCATCHKLKTLVKQLVEQNNIAAEVQYSSDFAEMARLGILSVPAIVIDGEIKSSSTIPKREDILKWLS